VSRALVFAELERRPPLLLAQRELAQVRGENRLGDALRRRGRPPPTRDSRRQRTSRDQAVVPDAILDLHDLEIDRMDARAQGLGQLRVAALAQQGFARADELTERLVVGDRRVRIVPLCLLSSRAILRRLRRARVIREPTERRSAGAAAPPPEDGRGRFRLNAGRRPDRFHPSPAPRLAFSF
jgi:hypothetical protein